MNLYDILGVSWKCSSEELRHQYHRLLLEYHPDKTINSTDSKRQNRFEEIKNAYQILSNIDLRRKYDQEQERLRLHSLPHTNLDLNQFEDEFFCRCGTILNIEKDNSLNILECPNCSTLIEILNK